MKKGLSVLLVLAVLAAGLCVFAGPEVTRAAGKLIYPKPYYETVSREAEEFSLDEDLVYAVMRTESRFNENARSHAGARGLMQLTDETFGWISSMYPVEGDIFDPGANIHCGCALLRLLLDDFGSADAALCAYNAGMGNVSAWLKDPAYSSDGAKLDVIPYPETAAYVRKVNKAWEAYRRIYGD